VPGGLLEVVGRGYTDFTAAMIAAEIKAKELQLWKEVDGIFSCDPVCASVRVFLGLVHVHV
jgi:aspartate kinase